MTTYMISTTEYGYTVEQNQLGSNQLRPFAKSLFKEGKRDISLEQDSVHEMIVASKGDVQIDSLKINNVRYVVLENMTGTIDHLVLSKCSFLKLRNLNGSKNRLQINHINGDVTVLTPLNVVLGMIEAPLKKLVIDTPAPPVLAEKTNILVCENLFDQQSEYRIIALKQKDHVDYFASKRDKGNTDGPFYSCQNNGSLTETKLALFIKQSLGAELENRQRLEEFRNKISHLEI